MKAPERAAGRPSPGPLVEVPESLATYLDGSPEAQATWDSLSADDRRRLAEWVRHAWTTHGQRDHAKRLFSALTDGPEALCTWSAQNRQLPWSSSAMSSIVAPPIC